MIMCSIYKYIISLSLFDICIVFTGVLACLDGYMNIALEQTEEYVNGQLKNKYGDAFIRGNNGQYGEVWKTFDSLGTETTGCILHLD